MKDEREILSFANALSAKLAREVEYARSVMAFEGMPKSEQDEVVEMSLKTVKVVDRVATHVA
jgi:hypothetical protein